MVADSRSRRRTSASPDRLRSPSSDRRDIPQVSKDELELLKSGAARRGRGMRAAWALVAVAVLGWWLLGGPGFDRALLASKRVVITGASQGIGEQLAYLYCSAGASVLLVARSKPRLAAVADECRRRAAQTVAGEGRGAVVVVTLSADLSDVKGCGGRVVAEAKKQLGGLDVLVLNHITTQVGPPFKPCPTRSTDSSKLTCWGCFCGTNPSTLERKGARAHQMASPK